MKHDLPPLTLPAASRRAALYALGALGTLGVVGAALLAPARVAAQTLEAPDALIMRVGLEVLRQIQADPVLRSGDIDRIMALVDGQLMPHVNFRRMTASAVGRFWRQATPEQRTRLQDEFKLLLVRTYSGALSHVTDQTLVLRPSRFTPQDTEVVVRTELRGRSEPIQIDYRLERTPQGWKVFDFNVMGIWLVDTYRNQFTTEINARGIDGLIAALTERNRAGAAAART
ncbi:ABC-type transport system involved in resistance to organic solvents, auxiliary component [Serpentinimonas maccroryi]|uniref:ABC-type transport system involved in resistance to organic solvents, auxiliary component n=1 Tax=Serpentinimonas maccroryi TaxID=1458426 RepID=A0A060NX14_9BURK|nr:ABC transporter substrate-binding protein [Serpentinimonas maccroryi]BAO84098.1 ABC-type transport system involved in resistance to organic solvents, auxiliary component [Serpentinimonas maccroryi]